MTDDIRQAINYHREINDGDDEYWATLEMAQISETERSIRVDVGVWRCGVKEAPFKTRRYHIDSNGFVYYVEFYHA